MSQNYLPVFLNGKKTCLFIIKQYTQALLSVCSNTQSTFIENYKFLRRFYSIYNLWPFKVIQSI